MNSPCEYCGEDLPLGVDKRTRRLRSAHFALHTKERRDAEAANQRSEMTLLTFPNPRDRVTAKSELVEKIHQAIAEYAGVMTVLQVIGALELVKLEVREQQ